jgi:hypothetical protein
MVTWRRNGEVQGSKRGAVDLAGVLWVESAGCGVVVEVFGAFLRQGEELLWWLMTFLASLMAVSSSLMQAVRTSLTMMWRWHWGGRG